jgi:hypothetical protein
MSATLPSADGRVKHAAASEVVETIEECKSGDRGAAERRETVVPMG